MKSTHFNASPFIFSPSSKGLCFPLGAGVKESYFITKFGKNIITFPKKL
ncbi:hypothetical protein IC006_0928 [Sulfuracidifex tepidarius]|uniref:Uncharacterized protein n=1 Tax=Sulfuracidifex tepidarius TaxID=1294262 RepID=A0A510DUA2_9CREN|nr:hypothetical protein IC006_0928 [Sulfuracidifex tepidarius]BBG26387.1 hypothetical protein IC007_0895 [Sulfuracidifex tepidarius]